MTRPQDIHPIVMKILDELSEKTRGIRLDFIQPGQPQQNAYIERYNRTVRYDWLAQTLFVTVEAVQESATRIKYKKLVR